MSYYFVTKNVFQTQTIIAIHMVLVDGSFSSEDSMVFELLVIRSH